MDAMPHPGGRPPGPVGHRSAPPPPPAAPSLDRLRRTTHRLDRRLIVSNAVCYGAVVLLAGAAPGLLATEVIGRINLGLLLCGALGVLAFLTAARYDRRSARDCDTVADRIRDFHEAEPPAPPQPLPTRSYRRGSR